MCAFFGPSSAVDFILDGQAVAIPARDVRRIEALHVFQADDKILQDFIEGGAEVDAAVGVRRTVVQNILRLAGTGGADRFVEPFLFPAREHFGLALREVGFHRKAGAGKVDGLLEIGLGRIH